MLRRIVSSLVNERQKRVLRRTLNSARKKWANTFSRFDGADLTRALAEMEVAPTDTLMVHANFRPDSGFQGTPHDLVSALLDLVGERGNLMMVSIPFRGYAYDYLTRQKPFHVKKTMSMMGLVTEMFRRRQGTLRSLHPTHPVLVYGAKSAWIAADHENCRFPTGTGTPFEKLCDLDGKILLFDLGFGALTLLHYAEHLLKDRLPFPLYDERQFSMTVIDKDERPREVQTFAFAKGVIRHQAKVEIEMHRRGTLRRRDIGNSTMLVAKARDVVDTMAALMESGVALLERPVH